MNRINSGFQTFDVRSSQDAQQRARLDQLETAFAELQREPKAILTVMAVVSPGRVVIAGSPPIETQAPLTAKVGSQVRAIMQNKNTFEVLPEPVSFGQIIEVASIVDGRIVAKVGVGEVYLAVADGLSLQAGDRVVLDPTGTVALLKLPGSSANASFVVPEAMKVSWDDIGGQQEAKDALREAIEYPVLFADVYAAHGQKPAKGAMLYGPPGTGKSLLARALATSLDGDASGFIYVKATEVMSKWQGESGNAVRALFRRGRDHQAKTGKRAVLFIDEADALLPVRDGGGRQVSGGLEDMVPVFLAEMDGLDDLGPFVLLGTNRPDRIDPAVLRDGRCETKVHVARPDRQATVDIFKLALRGRRVEDTDASARAATEALFSDRNILLELSYPGVMTSEYLRLRDLVSGAMITGIVQRAAARAIKRDREGGTLTPIGSDDFNHAIKLTLRQQASVNHDAVIREKSQSFGKLPERVRKVIDG